MQSFDIHYQHQIMPRGSTLYYSLLSVSNEQRYAVAVVRAFAKEVGEIILNCSDKSVALNKFLWWQGEFQQLLSTTPTHPITQALQIAINRFNLPIELFQEFITGVGQDLGLEFYNTVEDIIHYHHHTAGSVERIVAHILTFSDANTLSAVNNFGICIQMVRLLRDLRNVLSHHHCYIPLADLDKLQLSVAQLHQYVMTEEIYSLILMQADRAKYYYKIAMEQLPKADRCRQSSIIILAELSLKLLDQLISRDSNIFTEHISLTPLRKLFLAWRIHWREKL